ncbi:MAG: glycosyltransferase family 4 protein [Candidatus Eisenbacteria bacterium]|nr:glycosyltransferase family 4 protein [Candidatus Eisenbacteria bacterium]
MSRPSMTRAPRSRTLDTGTPDTCTPDTRTPDTRTPDTCTPDTRTPANRLPVVAYVVKMFPRFSETFIVNEILELERRGQELVIYSLKTPPPGPRHDTVARVKARVVYLPQSPWRAVAPIATAHFALLRRSPGRYLGTLGYVLERASWPAFKRFLQAGVLVRDAGPREVRHLHAHFATSATQVSMLAARLSGVTYSFTAHAKDIYLDRLDVDHLRAKLLEASFAVTVSDYNLRHLERICGREAAGRVVRIYNGIDIDRFRGVGEAREPGSVLCIGRLVEKKGIADLLEACALLLRRGADFRVRVVGEGPLREPLETRARELGLAGRVHFTGALPQEQVASDLRRAAVFALPCIVAADGNRDGLPTVILEAMASGTPVISTRVTGVPEMVQDGVTGVVVEPNQPEALAAALERILTDPALAARMGAQARRAVEEKFQLRANAGELHRLILQVVARDHRAVLLAAEADRSPGPDREPAAGMAVPGEARHA